MQTPEFLPNGQGVDTAKLSTVFADTTNSYKFYWFLSILDEIAEKGSKRLSLRDLPLRMLAGVWYPLDYFRLSFGKHDGFKAIAQTVSAKLVIDNRPNSPDLVHQLTSRLSEVELSQVVREVETLLRWVPFRFIRPFFAQETRGMPDQHVNRKIVELANGSSKTPYAFGNAEIVISDAWYDYLRHHQAILRGFTYWHLLRFVQKNNPSVIGLSEKLTKPGHRDFRLANRYWREYLASKGGLQCIYSGEPITLANISLDHFLPWSFVAHDHLWNLVPTIKSVNSSKSDWLPNLERYFHGYSCLHYDSFHFYFDKGAGSLLGDYTTLLSIGTEQIGSLTIDQFAASLRSRIEPQFQTALNLGFPYPFVFNHSDEQ